MRPRFNRRIFLGSSALGAASLAMPPGTPADEKDELRETYDYKVVDGCRIKLDVYGAPRDELRPVVVWIHGGALIMGHRGGIDRALLGALTKAGYVVVSIDYRLAPETKLPAIVEDVQDACRWVRERGPKLFRIAPERLAVMGGSAGGYLTLMTGFRVEPRPKALVSFWGYGDIAGAWYSRPDPFYRSQPLVPEKEAAAPSAARSSRRMSARTIARGSTFTADSRGSGPRKWPGTTLMPSRGRSTRSAPCAT